MVLYVIVCVFILDLPSSFLWWGFFIYQIQRHCEVQGILFGNHTGIIREHY
jgi:hypothetical protein